jgi:hypothetical protein
MKAKNLLLYLQEPTRLIYQYFSSKFSVSEFIAAFLLHYLFDSNTAQKDVM